METVQDKAFGVIPVFKNPDGDFLFCVVQHQGEHYGFPKGHAEPGESEEQTAIRELAEETGIQNVKIASGVIYGQAYHFTNAEILYDKTVKYFLGFVASTDTQTPPEFKTEISDLKWLSYQEARNQLTYEDTKIILDQVWDFLKS